MGLRNSVCIFLLAHDMGTCEIANVFSIDPRQRSWQLISWLTLPNGFQPRSSGKMYHPVAVGNTNWWYHVLQCKSLPISSTVISYGVLHMKQVSATHCISKWSRWNCYTWSSESKLRSHTQENEYNKIRLYQYISYLSFHILYVYKSISITLNYPLHEQQRFSFMQY